MPNQIKLYPDGMDRETGMWQTKQQLEEHFSNINDEAPILIDSLWHSLTTNYIKEVA